MQWKGRNDIIYFDESVEVTGTNYCVYPKKRKFEPSSGIVHTSRRKFAGSSSAAGVSSEGVGTLFDSTFQELDATIATTVQLSLHLPTTSSRLSSTAGVLPHELAFNEDAHRIVLDAEAVNLDHLQKSLSQIKDGFVMYKTMQDGRCKPFEEHAQKYLTEISKGDCPTSGGDAGAATAGVHTCAGGEGEHNDSTVPHVDKVRYLLYKYVSALL